MDVTQTASAEFMREGYTSVVNIKIKKIDRKYTAFNGGINSHSVRRFGIADASYETGTANILCTRQLKVLPSSIRSRRCRNPLPLKALYAIGLIAAIPIITILMLLWEATASGVMSIILRSALPSIIFPSGVRPMEKTC